MSNHLYVTLQDGVVRDTEPKAPCNFKVYKVPERDRDLVEQEIDSAWDGAGFTKYKQRLLDWIEKQDNNER